MCISLPLSMGTMINECWWTDIALLLLLPLKCFASFVACCSSGLDISMLRVKCCVVLYLQLDSRVWDNTKPHKALSKFYKKHHPVEASCIFMLILLCSHLQIYLIYLSAMLHECKASCIECVHMYYMSRLVSSHAINLVFSPVLHVPVRLLSVQQSSCMSNIQ